MTHVCCSANHEFSDSDLLPYGFVFYHFSPRKRGKFDSCSARHSERSAENLQIISHWLTDIPKWTTKRVTEVIGPNWTFLKNPTE
jgi:hypothetical protein